MAAFQYLLTMIANFNSYIGYVSLLNPMVYIMEAMLAAILGQQGYLNFWLCIGMILVFTIICALDGIRILKNRLDYV